MVTTFSSGKHIVAHGFGQNPQQQKKHDAQQTINPVFLDCFGKRWMKHRGSRANETIDKAARSRSHTWLLLGSTRTHNRRKLLLAVGVGVRMANDSSHTMQAQMKWQGTNGRTCPCVHSRGNCDPLQLSQKMRPQRRQW
jgi:hypothetical protein